MSTPLTNIRVFVEWTEQTVFAGEDIECQITFKNVATDPAPSRTSLHPTAANGFAPGGEKQRKTAAQARSNNNTMSPSPRPPPPIRGHRTTLSLNAPVGLGRSHSGPGSWTEGHTKASKVGSAHKRSVSIISIGASEGTVDDVASHASTVDKPRRMPRGHGRSASLQIISRRQGINGGPPPGKCYIPPPFVIYD
jgi:hypothetical protein